MILGYIYCYCYYDYKNRTTFLPNPLLSLIFTDSFPTTILMSIPFCFSPICSRFSFIVIVGGGGSEVGTTVAAIDTTVLVCSVLFCFLCLIRKLPTTRTTTTTITLLVFFFTFFFAFSFVLFFLPGPGCTPVYSFHFHNQRVRTPTSFSRGALHFFGAQHAITEQFVLSVCFVCFDLFVLTSVCFDVCFDLWWC